MAPSAGTRPEEPHALSSPKTVGPQCCSARSTSGGAARVPPREGFPSKHPVPGHAAAALLGRRAHPWGTGQGGIGNGCSADFYKFELGHRFLRAVLMLVCYPKALPYCHRPSSELCNPQLLKELLSLCPSPSRLSSRGRQLPPTHSTASGSPTGHGCDGRQESVSVLLRNRTVKIQKSPRPGVTPEWGLC